MASVSLRSTEVKMKVLELVPDSDHFNGVNVDAPVNQIDLLALAGREPDSWSPLLATPFRDPHRRKQPMGDVVEFFATLPVVSRRLREALDRTVDQGISYYPIRIRSEEFFIMAVRTFSNELDVQRSVFKRFPDGEIFKVVSYVFATPPANPIFKLSALGAMSPVLLTDSLYDYLIGQGVVGLNGCEKVWSSE